MSEEKFLFESMQDSQSIKAFLESLVEGFDKERVVLASNGDRIELCPQGLLEFTVKAKRKGGSNKLSLKIEWKDDRKQITASDAKIAVSTD